MFDPVDMATMTRGRWLGPCPTTPPVCFGHDTRESLEGGAYVAIRGESHDGHDYLEAARSAGAVMAIVDRAVDASIPCLLVEDVLAAIATLAGHWREQLAGTRVIAITGTAGKTTTKDLLHHVLGSSLTGSASPASWNNHIGGPMSLLRARPGDDYVILEMGTSSPGEIASLARCARPDVGIITLVGRGHLEGLQSVEGVRKEKYSLLDHLSSEGMAIVHDDGHEVDVRNDVTVLRHGDRPSSDPRLMARDADGLHLSDGSRFVFHVPGRHQAINALAVIATARIAGLGDDRISEALSSSLPSAGRGTELLRSGVRFVDDAYNANPDSVAASLAAFPEVPSDGRRIVILGDMLELGEEATDLHADLKGAIQASHDRRAIDHLFLVGQAMSSLANQVRDHGPCPVTAWERLDDAAIDHIVSAFHPGDLVLIKGSRGMRLERIIRKTGDLESEAATA